MQSWVRSGWFLFRYTKVATDVSQKHVCCLDEACSEKVRRLFPDPNGLSTDAEWLELVLTWANSTRICNMHIERALAKCRRSVGKADAAARPDAAYVCSAGLVGEFLSTHLKHGGKLPGVEVRSDRSLVPLSHLDLELESPILAHTGMCKNN